MLLQGQDGELRISDAGRTGVTHYVEVLFAEMDFTGPTSRPRTEENLIMNRNKFDTNAHYILGPDNPRYEPIPVSFSCKISDTSKAWMFSDWLSGVTKLTSGASITQFYSTKGTSKIDGNTLPNFNDSTGKYAYNIEILWDGCKDYGVSYPEVYFPPGEQTITESADGLVLSVNGMVYGDVTRITAFSAGMTAII